jgi:hypothetical protein
MLNIPSHKGNVSQIYVKILPPYLTLEWLPLRTQTTNVGEGKKLPSYNADRNVN